MCRAHASLIALLLVVSLAPSQVTEVTPDDEVEQYLEAHGLLELRASQLRQRLADARGEERSGVATRLGDIYVEMLAERLTIDERQRVEALSYDLLRSVPDADSTELRLSLAKARYLAAEDLAEGHRLRSVTPEERLEAERILRQVQPQFKNIGQEAHRRVETLEQRERRMADDDAVEIRRYLADARRIRSLAMYYSGWSNYYIALLTGSIPHANEALQDFGWLLNATPGREANLERVVTAMLRYDHVARAALGCSMSALLKGDDVEAIRWLDLVEGAEETSPAIREQMFTRRLIVFAGAKRWSDLAWAVRRYREATENGVALRPLTEADARLLCVLLLDVLRQSEAPAGREEIIEELTQAAMADLVRRGEVQQIVNLATTFGAMPRGLDGFVVQYVRAIQAYTDARDAHRATGEDIEEPTRRTDLHNAYMEASRLLRGARESDDASTFEAENTKAGLLEAFCHYYGGDLVGAAERFATVAENVSSDTEREEALWFAIVSLDRAVEGGRKSSIPRRDELATIYLQAFPTTERAAHLLLRRIDREMLSDEDAIGILLAVDASSPLYETARRHASRLLYRMARNAPRAKRAIFASRFADVGLEVLELDRAELASEPDGGSDDVVHRVVLRSRQLLDALLSSDAPDAQRAAHVLRTLEDTARRHDIDLDDVRGELAYRQFQIANILGDRTGLSQALNELASIGGQFAELADVELYRTAVEHLTEQPLDVDAARRVVEFGSRMYDRLPDEETFEDPIALSLAERISAAAFSIWRATGEEAALATSRRLDEQVIDAGHQTATLLYRYAELSETSGEIEDALNAWRTLLAGIEEGVESWYEARYHSIRLLLQVDPGRARVAMSQFRAIHPSLGPGGWPEKFEDLQDDLDRAPRTSRPEGGG